MSWYKLIIDVDYWPSDPGCRNHYCERTERLVKDLQTGQNIGYNDPSEILPSITSYTVRFSSLSGEKFRPLVVLA